ncbi:MAG: FkbM family methyltransferase [Saprospiraceae bacterium]|jgi:FkbM family methyltransferase
MVQTILPEQSEMYFQLWLKLIWKLKPNTIQWYLNEYAKREKDVFFIQIGSNDGFLGDPIYKFIRRDQWSGVLIEPVEYLFQQLRKNYTPINNDLRLSFEQVAISNELGHKDFYYVKDFEVTEELPVYLNQQGSFNKAHLDAVKQQFPKVEIGTVAVPCKMVSSIVEKYQPKRIDLIHIDTEGHDFAIVKSIDFQQLQPKMIYFEHRHMTRAQRDELIAMLKSQDYDVLEEEHDTFAWTTAEVAVDYANMEGVLTTA